MQQTGYRMYYEELNSDHEQHEMHHIKQSLCFVLLSGTWSQKGYSVFCMSTLLSLFANYQNRHQPHKWSGLSTCWLQMTTLQSSSGVCVGIHGLKYSLYHPWGLYETEDASIRLEKMYHHERMSDRCPGKQRAKGEISKLMYSWSQWDSFSDTLSIRLVQYW